MPAGWTRTTIAAITRLRRERVEPSEARDRALVGLENIERDTGRLVGDADAATTRSDKAGFRRGDVLYARLRPNLNKVWRATFDGSCSTEFLVLRRLRHVDPDWLALRLLADDVVAHATVGATSSLYPRVSYERLGLFELAIPPLAEQTRIARRVRTLQARLLEAASNAEQARAEIEAYRKSMLALAFDGELTRDWREARHAQVDDGAGPGEPSRPPAVADGRPSGGDDAGEQREPHGWLRVRWDAIGSEQNGRAFPSTQYSDQGVRLLRPGNLAPDGGITWKPSATRHLPPEVAARSPELRVGPGELIINLTAQSLAGGFLGRVCMTGRGDDCILNQRLARLNAPDLSTRFLFHMLRSPQFRRFVDGLSTGSMIQHISTKQLADFVVPVPPVEEQSLIADRLDGALAGMAVAEERVLETLARIDGLRRSILRSAADGRLVAQVGNEGTAQETLRELAEEIAAIEAQDVEEKIDRRRRAKMPKTEKRRTPLSEAVAGLGRAADARALFDAAGYEPEQAGAFYEDILMDGAVLEHFKSLAQRGREPLRETLFAKIPRDRTPGHRFRLVELWIGEFKNLRDYRVEFDPAHAIDIVLGWNGTGKSNLFEALVVIFRDLLMARGKLPATEFAYRIRYEIGGRTVELSWSPEGKRQLTAKAGEAGRLVKIGRDDIPLPRFVFGYYSGPTNRLAEHFRPLDREHYQRLVESASDDPAEMLRLLEERRFFCAEVHHAKYVMLGYFHKEDEVISQFLRERLRIVGFGAAVFVIRKPDWAQPGEDASTFWGARGVVRHFLERLRRIALAPLRILATVDEGYRQTREEQLHFLIPDAEHLRLLADEYPDARTFFLALESADFSRMVREVKVSVVVDGAGRVGTPILFREMSEGEQQLLTVLGLLRFTKSHDSLVLLDEPDTHLNPHWSIDYLDLLGRIMDDGEDLATSQILMSTHDPLVIVAQEKEQIHLLRRTRPEGRCEWRPATESPRGLGFTGILTSEMFGFGSDLDRPTLELLHRQAVLAGKETLSDGETARLKEVTDQIEALGFRTASSDPYYRAFLKGVARRPRTAALLNQQFLDTTDMAELADETDEILAEIEAEEAAAR
ncbi:MAG TPA: AAA family ATPase [Sphingomonas sp.]|uniref:AAA family ATPase n=1 Tax=Sphingomonas sp. TaxID=28214 RepID=UPI002ED9C118